MNSKSRRSSKRRRIRLPKDPATVPLDRFVGSTTSMKPKALDFSEPLSEIDTEWTRIKVDVPKNAPDVCGMQVWSRGLYPSTSIEFHRSEMCARAQSICLTCKHLEGYCMRLGEEGSLCFKPDMDSPESVFYWLMQVRECSDHRENEGPNKTQE